MFIWTVVMTSYEDDYKHRCDDGIYPQAPVLFATEKAAESYVCKQLIEALEARIDDQWSTNIDTDVFTEECQKYFNKVKHTNNDNKSYDYYDYSINPKYKNDLDVLETLRTELLAGEYVDVTIDYTITKGEVRE